MPTCRFNRDTSAMVYDFPSVMNEMPSEGHLRGVYGDYWPYAARIAWVIVLRTAASEAQNHRCCYCGIRTTFDGAHWDRPTLEHVVPRVRGGRDERDNCVMACNVCNASRGETRIAEECFLDGGTCDVPTAVERFVGSRSASARRRRMREAMRTPDGWAMSDGEVSVRHDVNVDEVVKFRAHRTLVLSMLEAQGRTCPACGRHVRDDGSVVASTVDGLTCLEVVHRGCQVGYRERVAGRGTAGDARARQEDGH